LCFWCFLCWIFCPRLFLVNRTPFRSIDLTLVLSTPSPPPLLQLMNGSSSCSWYVRGNVVSFASFVIVDLISRSHFMTIELSFSPAVPFSVAGVFFLSRLDEFQKYHHPRSTTCRVLDLATILRLPINCDIHWKPHVDPVPPLPLPASHRLFHTDAL
jgi:hypothetical protein